MGEACCFSCAPLAGRALVFQHNILHEGEEVREGVKYTIRTDVEYGGESWGAWCQELAGLGCSPQDRRRRLRLVAGPVLAFGALLLSAAVTKRLGVGVN